MSIVLLLVSEVVFTVTVAVERLIITVISIIQVLGISTGSTDGRRVLLA